MVKQNDNTSKDSNGTASYIEKSDSVYSIKAPTEDKELYDTISFIPCECETFIIEGCDNIPLESNSIYKAYKAILDFTDDVDVEEFFTVHKIVVTKSIPLNTGFRGAASNAAAFLLLVKELCNLVLSRDELVTIGSNVSSDVPYFIDTYLSHKV